MTTKQAQAVIDLMLTADGGCKYCVADMLGGFAAIFPECINMVIVAWEDAFHERWQGVDYRAKNTIPLPGHYAYKETG